MPKILWLVDGVGWGYDNLANAIKKELPMYEHIMLSKDLTRALIYGRNCFVGKGDNDFEKRIDNVNADIVISMNPKNSRFLKNKKRSILRFSGERAMCGWRR